MGPGELLLIQLFMIQAEVHAVRERQEFIEKLLDRPRSEHPGQLPPG